MNSPASTLVLETAEIDISDDPLWYRDAVIYQLNVKAFFDSNEDGMGDFKGVTTKLDYVKDLGVNTIWLINDDEAPELLAWALERGHQLRFIEQMPLDADHAWDRGSMITAAEIRARIGVRFELTPDVEPRDGAPAELFRVRDRATGVELGLVGIIASVSEPFCTDCRRTRLTAEGGVRSCLFSHSETDLLGPLRAGASDLELAELWRDAMWAKPQGHGLDDDSFVQPARSMSAIGG